MLTAWLSLPVTVHMVQCPIFFSNNCDKCVHLVRQIYNEHFLSVQLFSHSEFWILLHLSSADNVCHNRKKCVLLGNGWRLKDCFAMLWESKHSWPYWSAFNLVSLIIFWILHLFLSWVLWGFRCIRKFSLLFKTITKVTHQKCELFWDF